MLSHHNMLSVAHGGLTLLDCYQEDVFLSFLPLSHTLERTVGYYLCIMTGSCVAYARSVAQLGEDLVTIRPTVLVAVPRIFERVYGRISDQMEKKGWLGKAPVRSDRRHRLETLPAPAGARRLAAWAACCGRCSIGWSRARSRPSWVAICVPRSAAARHSTRRSPGCSSVWV